MRNRMSKFPRPPESRNAVRRSGKRIRDNIETDDDIVVLNQWRDSHAYVLNTFQATLRGMTKGTPSEVGQRLKRRDTIVDKIKTGRSSDLLTMHDLAGCRIIFNSMDELYDFRREIYKRKWEHELKSSDKYNYIEAPKNSGYRGIHDVFRTKLRKAPLWSGLSVEIQYRTDIQHAWATAVEVADSLRGTRVKFESDGDRFFQLCSEALARKYEKLKSCLPDLSDDQIVNEIKEIEDQTQKLNLLSSLKSEDIEISSQNRFIVLVLEGSETEAFSFSNPSHALDKRSEIETKRPNANVVYVSAANPVQVKNAFKNYFKNTKDFVDLMNRCLSEGLG